MKQASAQTQAPRTLRILASRAVAATVLLLVLFLIGAATVSLMLRSSAPQNLASQVHHWLTMARPVVLTLQLVGLSTIWWKWHAIIRWAKFAEPVEQAWLAVRDRMFFWGLALIVLSVFLWSA